MKVLEKGRVYSLDYLNYNVDFGQLVIFASYNGNGVKDGEKPTHGTTMEEVLKMLIDRLETLEIEYPKTLNKYALISLNDALKIINKYYKIEE